MDNLWIIYGQDNLWIWLVVEISTPLKKLEFVNWDDDIPNSYWENKSHVQNHQPGYDPLRKSGQNTQAFKQDDHNKKQSDYFDAKHIRVI